MTTDFPFILLDLETTGFDPVTDAIIEVAAIRVEQGEIVDRFEYLTHPERDLPPTVIGITRISNEMLKDAPSFENIKDELVSFLGNLPIIGHNISFDLSFLRERNVAKKNSELDTFALSTLLLPKQSTYALEALSDKFSISHTEKHRAMGDVLANFDLWNILKEKAVEIQTAEREGLQNIFQKSTWIGAQFFTYCWQYPPKQPSPLPVHVPSPKLSPPPSVAPEGQLSLFEEHNNSPQKTTETIFDFSQNHLQINSTITAAEIWGKIESDPHNPILVLPPFHLSSLEHIENIRWHDLPEYFLDPKKYETYFQKEVFSEKESVMLSKIMLQKNHCDGHLRHFAFQMDELPCWFSFFASTNVHEIPSNSCILPLRCLLSNPNLFSDRPLLFLGGESFDRDTEKIYSEKLSQRIIQKKLEESNDELQESWDLFWGMIGTFAREHTEEEPNEWGITTTVSYRLRETYEWKNMEESLQELLKKSPQIEEKSRDMLQTFFAGAVPNMLDQISVNGDGVTSLSRIPISLATMLHPFWESRTTATLFLVRTFSPFLLQTIGFPLSFSLPKKEKTPRTILRKESLPPPNNEAFFSTVAKAISQELFEENSPKKQMVLCPSLSFLRSFFEYLLPQILKQDLPKIVVQGMGGKHKIISSLQTEDPVIFLGTISMTDILDAFSMQFEKIFLIKIPFPYTETPLLKARNAHLNKEFLQFSLPLASWIWQKSLEMLLVPHGEVVVCDSRVWEKQYGKDILGKE